MEEHICRAAVKPARVAGDSELSEGYVRNAHAEAAASSDTCLLRNQTRNCSKRMFFRLALCALLLFAQRAAIAHQAAHALDHGPIQSQHSADHGNFHSDLCAFHADFDSLLCAIESAPPALWLSSAAFEQHPAPFPRCQITEPVIPASRGPPVASSLQS